MGNGKPAAHGSSFNQTILNAIALVGRDRGWAVGDCGVVFSSSDSGRHWVVVDVARRANLRSVHFVDDLHGWMVGDLSGRAVALRTIDGGKHWTKAYAFSGPEQSSLSCVWFNSPSTGWATGEVQASGRVEGVVLGTTDGGASWQLQYSGGLECSTLQSIVFADDSVGWAVGHNLVLLTADGGRNWQAVLRGRGDYYFDVAAVGRSDCWVVGDTGRILRSTDGGHSWARQEIPNLRGDPWFTSICFQDSRHGWIVGDNGTILKSDDGGSSWCIDYSGRLSLLRGVSATDEETMVVGNGGTLLRRSNR